MLSEAEFDLLMVSQCCDNESYEYYMAQFGIQIAHYQASNEFTLIAQERIERCEL